MSNFKNGKDYKLKDVEKLVKPRISVEILGTLVCISPYGNLLIKIVNKDYSNLLLPTLLTFPTLILMSIFWCWYFHSIKHYKKVAKDIFEQTKKNLKSCRIIYE